MPRVPLVLKGVWWRRGTALALLAVATISCASASLGPLYAKAAGESTLRDQLTQAPVIDTALHFQVKLINAPIPTDPEEYHALLADTAQVKRLRGYPSAVPGVFFPIDAGVGTHPGVKTRFVWRPQACAHLTIVSGRCPSGPNEVVVGQRTIDDSGYGWKIGSTIDASILDLQNNTVAIPAKIVGSYVPKNVADPYWFGVNYFNAHPGSQDSSDTVDAVFLSQAGLDALPRVPGLTASVDYALDAAAIRLRDVPTLRREATGLKAKYAGSPYDLETNLTRVLDDAAHQRHLVDTGTALVTLQLCLLAWLVLFQVVADAVDARGNEIAQAKLRGHSPLATLRFGLGEPILLLLLAAPIGFLVALLAARLFAATVLVPGTPVAIVAASFIALAAALAGGVLATGLAATRTLTRTVLQQWRRTRSRQQHSRITLVIDVLLAAAALAALFVLRSRHKPGAQDTAALLAPGLLVLAVALIGVRLLPLVVRALLPGTRASNRVGLFLAARQVVRRPAGLRLVALLAVAGGLAAFAIVGESVASTNRTARAGAELGADQVISIQYERGHDPIDATHAADPAGKWAMTAATWLPDGGGSVDGRVLAVDSTRLKSAGLAAQGGPSVSRMADSVGASAVPVLPITASRMRVRISASGITGPRPNVTLNLRSASTPYLDVRVGALQDGTHDYSAAVPCRGGCTLLGITWDRPAGTFTPMKGSTVVHSLDAADADGSWKALNAQLTNPHGWRTGRGAGARTDAVSAAADGLHDEYTSDDGGFGGVTYAFSASPLPVLATRSAVALPPDGSTNLAMADAFQVSAAYKVVGYVPVLPVVLDNGLIVDVSFLRSQLPGFDSEATWQVWLGPKAPADAVARLKAAGLIVQTVAKKQTRIDQLGRQGPALSLFLLLACAIAGSALAVGGTAIAISAGARRRSFETAALRAIGVPRRTLFRAGLLEQLLLLGAALLLGLPTGIAGARLVMPTIPEFADTTPIKLTYLPHLTPVLLFVVGFVALVCLTAFIAATSVMRAARPERLRGGEE